MERWEVYIIYANGDSTSPTWDDRAEAEAAYARAIAQHPTAQIELNDLVEQKTVRNYPYGANDEN